jgi:hypothetical protein
VFYVAGGTVRCEKNTGTPNVSALPGPELGVEVKNEKCTFTSEVPAFPNSPYVAEQVGSSEYLYYADGEYVLNSPLTFRMPNMGPGGCTLEFGVSPQHEPAYLYKYGSYLAAYVRAEHMVYEWKPGNCYALNPGFPGVGEAELPDGFFNLEWTGV